LDLQIVGAVLKPLALGDLRALLETHRLGSEPEPIVEVERPNGTGAPAVVGPHGVLDASALVVPFQPQRARVDSVVTGAEALVRWQHPDLGLVSPATFLARAERTGFMRALTTAVLQDSVVQCRRWALAGFRVPVAVNLSPGLLDDLTL